MKFGFERLHEQLTEFVTDIYEQERGDDGRYGPLRGDSEIERLLFLGLVVRTSFGGSEYEAMLVPESEDREKALIVRPQATIGARRADFLVHAFDHRRTRSWRRLIVECDGHDFHERTKVQARRDRSRDRLALMDGYDCFRFTGSEIWSDPWGCAGEILNWAAVGWG